MTIPHHRLDPEVAPSLEGLMEATAGGFNLHDLAGSRALVADMVTAAKREAPGPEGVASADRRVPGPAGAPDVAVRIYRPANRAEPLPALVWMHGGGWVLGSIEMDDLTAMQIARDVNCAVVSVNYRLAPEHPFPAPLEDCHAVFRWVAGESSSLRVDPGRIAVGGASAGANLAAGLALMARDRRGVQPAFQLLLHPVLDDGNVAQAGESLPDNPFWSRENALMGWRSYLGCHFGARDVPVYAAPIRAAGLTGLAPAYIAAAEVDMFADDAVEYARRLMRAGVTTELHVYPGTFHAFESIAPLARISQQFSADRNTALKRAFASG